MNGFGLVRRGLLLASFAPLSAFAVMPTNPVTDAEFMRLPDGSSLSDIKVSGVRLGLSHGTGKAFTPAVNAKYQSVKEDAMKNPNSRVQFVLMDLDAHRIVEQSASAGRRLFGASVAKVYVASTLMDKQKGTMTASQKQLFADMLVVSSNTAWTNLQAQIGNGNSDKGREAIFNFTQRMGYVNTRGWQGSWGSRHGNELTAADLAELLHDTYKGRYAGAEIFWKFMHTCRTGGERGRKYLPSNLIVGGKTGTYDGPTQIDGVTTSVKVRNHIMVFNWNGHQYGLTILADTGSDETAAALAGGLIREYLGVP
jgi:hypothetical protein